MIKTYIIFSFQALSNLKVQIFSVKSNESDSIILIINYCLWYKKLNKDVDHSISE